MNRRHAIGTMGAASLAGLAAKVQAQGATAAAAPAKNYSALQASAAACVVKGQTCLAHCIRFLSMGDKSMAECAKALNQMLALCGALQSIAAQGSTLTPSLAKVALEACTQCANACKPHIEHHEVCNACYESCIECIKHCKAVAA